MVPGVGNRLLLRAQSRDLDAITRNPKPFQQIRMKVRVANTASAGTVTPNETVAVPTDKMDMLIKLSLEVGEAGHLYVGVKENVLAYRPKAKKRKEANRHFPH